MRSLTTEQIDMRARNLAAANRQRCARAQLLKEIQSGSRDVLAVIEHDESGCPLVDVIRAIPRVGDTLCAKLMAAADLSHNVCLGGQVTSCRRPATERERAVAMDVVRAFLERCKNSQTSEAKAA